MQTSKNQYTLENLRQDIIRQFEVEEKSSKETFRDAKYKLKIILYIISLAQKIDSNKDQDVHNVIKSKLSDDSSLFSYTFFVSTRSQFDYSWNYLRTQWSEYEEKLCGACTFILDMIEKVNMILELGIDFNADVFVFADIFVFGIDKEQNGSQIVFKWDGMNNIFQLNNGYYLSAKQGKGILMTHFFSYKKKDDIRDFIKHLKDW